MGIIGEALLREIEDADKNEDKDRLMPLLEYAIVRAREQLYLRGGKIAKGKSCEIIKDDDEYLPTSMRG